MNTKPRSLPATEDPAYRAQTDALREVTDSINRGFGLVGKAPFPPIEEGSELDTQICFAVGALERDQLEDAAADAEVDFDKWTTSDDLRARVIEAARGRGGITLTNGDGQLVVYGRGYESPCLLLGARQPDQVWLVAYGLGGCWSGYEYATIITAAGPFTASKAAGFIAVRELRGAEKHKGISFDVECIDAATGPAGTSLYASRLRPEAKAMLDTHWASREAILEHWRQALQGEDSVAEQASALGFESVDEMRSSEAWAAQRRAHHAEEAAYQASLEAQQRRDAAGAPASTWVAMDVVAPAVAANEIESAVADYPRPGGS